LLSRGTHDRFASSDSRQILAARNRVICHLTRLLFQGWFFVGRYALIVIQRFLYFGKQLLGVAFHSSLGCFVAS
jgi:hypothetical protein